MASSEKDIDKILRDIEKRRRMSGAVAPSTPTADVVVQQKDRVLVKGLKTVELKKAVETAKPTDNTKACEPEKPTPPQKTCEVEKVGRTPVRSFNDSLSQSQEVKAASNSMPGTPHMPSFGFTPVSDAPAAPLQAPIASKSRSMSDIQKLVLEIKKEKPASAPAYAGTAPSKPASAPAYAGTAPKNSGFSSGNSDYIPRDTVPKNSLGHITPSPQPSEEMPSKLEDDFLSKLADVLNDKSFDGSSTSNGANVQQRDNAFVKPSPAAQNNFSDKTALEKTSDEIRHEQSTAEKLVDDKFVDFFTQSIVVPHQPTQNVTVRHKKHGFFKKKYITDSLSLALPEEDVKKAEKSGIFAKAKGMTEGVSDFEPHTPEEGAPMPPHHAVVPSAVAESSPLAGNPTLKNSSPLADNPTLESSSTLASCANSNGTSGNTAAILPEMENIASDITAMFMAKQEDNAQTINCPLPDATDKRTVSQHSFTFHKILGDSQDTPDKEPVFEEYILNNEFASQYGKEDPDEILEELHSFKTTLTFRLALSLTCAVVLIYLNLSANMGLPLPAFMSPTAQPMVFYVVSLVFYAIAVIGFLPTIANGFVGIFKTPTSDSFLSLSCVMCMLQLNLAIFNATKIETKTSTIFAGFFVLALSFNALGKLICTNTISRNLSLADVPDGINAGYIVKDAEEVKKLSRTLEEKSPQILVSRKTGSISNFISGGFSAHSSEKNAKKIALFTYAVTLVCFIIGYLSSKDFTVAVFTAAGASVLMLPLSHTLIWAVPSSLMQKALKQVGALVNGWQGIDQLSKTTHVSFDAKHLFPKGSVVLHGIKTFEKERLDLAILYAASIAVGKIDNLRPVFLNVIEDKTDMLYPLESCEYKVGQGYIAWIEHNRIIMGNRSIMGQFDIELPPVSLETKFTAEGKKPIYLSVNGKLFGMFIVSYHPDPSVKDNLDRLIENGVNVILQSNDFNVDSQLLELIYHLPTDTVQVLNQNETALLLNYTQYAEKTESCLAHLDSLYSLVAGFCGADSAKSAASTCCIVQTVSIFIGAVLALMFAYSQTLPAIPLISVILLGLGWMGLCLMRAFAKKYY
ncbi:MAG: hypothetical protein RR846_07685 [Oscillospiraceae bacterium]